MSIALIDSGLGGLSVMREVQRLLPHHDLHYVADSAYCPYGPLPPDLVRHRTLLIGRWLVQHGCQLLVVACNTATSAALELLRTELPIPVIGMEPGIKPATQQTQRGIVGVLATSGTLGGGRFATLVERYANGIQVLTQPCPGWVELVESGEITGQQAEQTVSQMVLPLLERGADVLVLGCTHYPFLLPVISAVAPHTAIIDTGPAVARQVARVVAQQQIASGTGERCYWTSGNPAAVAPVLRILTGDASAQVLFADLEQANLGMEKRLLGS